MLNRLYCSSFYTEATRKLSFVKKELNRCPKGTLKSSPVKVNGKVYDRFYANTLHNGKSKREWLDIKGGRLEAYAYKAYLEEMACRVENNCALLKPCVDGLKDTDIKSVMMAIDSRIAKHIDIQKVEGLEAIIQNVSRSGDNSTEAMDSELASRVREWSENSACGNYDKLMDHPESLKHRTSKGWYVRSKSELSIAEILYRYGIAFRYEAEIEINGVMLHPDFTVMRADGTLMYWEHFGLMNDHEYVRVMKRKLEMYEQAGIVPWRNLIVTYDTNDGTLDLAIIESEIKNKILCR